MGTKDLEHYERYGWKCNEDNLNTLPATAPQEARDLAKWLTLEGRRSSLEEWLGCLDIDTGRVHGKFWGIGAWTERMSHSRPNQANIPAVFTETPRTAVEEVKAKYNGPMRAAFTVPSGSWLVGTDADGIQLRVLAHYMRSTVYRDAILKGDKAKGTDIHSVNQRALGSICRSRDDAKTFIYAWLLGAGLAKIASILQCSIPQAKLAEQSFLRSLPELETIRKSIIPRDARRGYFLGFDGRKVLHNQEYKMLAGYLQNGEAVVMKHAAVLWNKWARAEGLNYKFVNFVHDEWQTEVTGTYADAERMGELQKKAISDVGDKFNLFCPLEGTSKVGMNWEETH